MYGCENEQIIKEKESIGIIKNLGLINNIEEYQKMYDHVCRRYKSRKIRLKNIDETRNYLIEEIIQNELISQKHKHVYRVLNYIEHLLVLISRVTGCVSIPVFASLVAIPIGNTISAIELKIWVIIAVIKKYKSIIKKKKKKHDKISEIWIK